MSFNIYSLLMTVFVKKKTLKRVVIIARIVMKKFKKKIPMTVYYIHCIGKKTINTFSFEQNAIEYRIILEYYIISLSL